MTFEPATNTGPVTIYTSSTPNDPREVLPAAAVKKFTALSQRSIDTRAAVPDFSVLQEAAKLQTERQNRIDHLLRRRPDGGMGQDETSPSVLDERRKLERATRMPSLARAIRHSIRTVVSLQAAGGGYR